MEVFKARGLTPSNSEAWSVGLSIQAAYRRRYGKQPPKENRPKTNGGGTHCFAVYPPSWRKKIDEAIDLLAVEAAKQAKLF